MSDSELFKKLADEIEGTQTSPALAPIITGELEPAVEPESVDAIRRRLLAAMNKAELASPKSLEKPETVFVDELRDTNEPTPALRSIVDAIEGAGPHRGANDEIPDESDSGRAELKTGGFDVDDLNRQHSLVLMGSKAVVVKERPDGPIEDRVRVLTIDALNAWFANKKTEIEGSDGKIRVTTWARRWVTHPRRRQFSGIEFFPNPDDAAGTPDYLNLWRGFGVKASSEGSYAIFRDHLLTNVCGEDQELFKYLFAWFAHIVQRPRERVGTAIVLRGRMGTGKTIVGEVMGSLYPAHYFQVDDPRYITGQFNAHMASCLLLQAEEAVWAGDKQAEGRLKGLITSESQMIESKGIDPIRIRNYVRVLMTSNEEWVVPAGKDERRFCVLDINPRCAQNHEYFREMKEELDRGGRERLLHDLFAFDLESVNLRQIPRTAALFEQKLRSLDPIENWLWSRLFDGNPTRSIEGWPSSVRCDAMYKDYIHQADEIGVRRKRNPSEFGLRLAKLIPGLERTRPRFESAPGEFSRPWCYVLPPLQDCREAFDNLMGQAYGWPEVTSEGGREPENFDPEFVPV